MLIRRAQSGDTIVEVLIATAVVGILLTGSFAVANRSSQVIRSAQERTEAQKITTRMLERLKSYAVVVSAPLPTTGAFCINDTNAIISAPCADGRYSTKVEYDSGNTVYIITTQWDSIVSGAPQEQLIIRYRVQ